MAENGKLQIALPEPDVSLPQDAEWCVVRLEDEWRQVRFHDYNELYSVPGLYERIIYDVLGCDSPRTIRSLLEAELRDSGTDAAALRVLDLGAGNGMVGEELAEMGVKHVVGVDIIEEAAAATQRDRPGIYDDYHVGDMSTLKNGDREKLAAFNFNAMICIAALGFGDIPPMVFANAYNLVSEGGWIAFNIKEDFLSDRDDTGFSGMMRAMVEGGTMEILKRKRYQHRLATNGDPLFYTAIIGRKLHDIDIENVPA